MIKIVEKAKGFYEEHEEDILFGGLAVLTSVAGGLIGGMLCSNRTRLYGEDAAKVWDMAAKEQALVDNTVIQTLCVTTGLDEAMWPEVTPLKVDPV